MGDNQNPEPAGRTARLPLGLVFSTTIRSASGAIHARFVIPTANIRSISAQQHPRQNMPCLRPSRNAAPTPLP